MLISHVMITVPNVIAMVGGFVVTYLRAFYSLPPSLTKVLGEAGLGGQAGTDGPVKLRL